MEYYEAVGFLRSVCGQFNDKGDFGRYYRGLDLLVQAHDTYFMLKKVEGTLRKADVV